MIERTGDVADFGTKAAVGAAGATYTYLGLPASVWVSVFTIVYLITHTVAVAPKAIETIKRWVAYWRK